MLHFTSCKMRVYAIPVSLEEARKHYKDMAEGKLQNPPVIGYEKLGRLFAGMSTSSHTGGGRSPVLQKLELVTPVAMATEQARAKIKIVRRMGIKKKKTRNTTKKKNQRGGAKKKHQPIKRKQKKNKKKKKKKTAPPNTKKKVIRGMRSVSKVHKAKRRARDNFT